MTGKFVVIEGIDGAGKTTQTKLLLNFLKKQKIKTSFYKFPQYSKNIYGQIIADFLSGKFGELEKVNPYLISLAYALDRSTVRDKLNEEKRQGKIIITDRYSASNKAYQASRLKPSEQKKFIDWLEELDHKVNQNPKADLVILLDMPVKESLKLIDDRKKDLLEKKEILEKTRKIYLKLAKQDNRWEIINCIDQKGKLKSKNKIHEEIVETLKKKYII